MTNPELNNSSNQEANAEGIGREIADLRDDLDNLERNMTFPQMSAYRPASQPDLSGAADGQRAANISI